MKFPRSKPPLATEVCVDEQVRNLFTEGGWVSFKLLAGKDSILSAGLAKVAVGSVAGHIQVREPIHHPSQPGALAHCASRHALVMNNFFTIMLFKQHFQDICVKDGSEGRSTRIIRVL